MSAWQKSVRGWRVFVCNAARQQLYTQPLCTAGSVPLRFMHRNVCKSEAEQARIRRVSDCCWWRRFSTNRAKTMSPPQIWRRPSTSAPYGNKSVLINMYVRVYRQNVNMFVLLLLLCNGYTVTYICNEIDSSPIAAVRGSRNRCWLS